MNKPNTEIKRWGVIVIQSLCPSDIKTGKNLFDDIIRYNEYRNKESFSSFYDVHSIEEFNMSINDVERSLREGDIITLHIETHGSDNGISFSNGEVLNWKKFYDVIRPLNIKTGHLLFVVMAMCKSIAMISSINPENRAPYRAFICTTRIVSADEIQRGFSAFYDSFFNLLDISKALTALQEEVRDTNGISPFQVLSAESVFDETFNSNRDISGLVDEQLIRLDLPVTETTRLIMTVCIQKILSEIHVKCEDYYNFRDIYQC